MLVFALTIGCGLVLALTSALTFWPVTIWYDFYRPLVMFIAGYFVGLAIAWIFIDISGRCISSFKKQYTKPSKFARFLLNNGLLYINWHAGARVKCIGLEKIPSEPVLIVGNHKSKFDPMIVSEVLSNRHIAFMTKEDNMKIPLGARLMWRNCYMPVDRSDKLQSLEQFKKGAELIASGASSVAIYPEGSRQKPDVILADFHNGTFNIATKTGCPIVIITMRNTHMIHKNFPFKTTKVEMKCVQVIYQDEYKNMNATELSDYVHNIMYEELKSAI